MPRQPSQDEVEFTNSNLNYTMTRTRTIGVISLAALAALVVFATSVATTRADERGRFEFRFNDDHKKTSFLSLLKTKATSSQVRVDDNNVRVNGATVTATSTSGFTATANGTTFSVTSDANTKFEVKGIGRAALAHVAVGDIVNFRGVILSGANTTNVSVRAIGVEDKTMHAKNRPVAPSTVATSTVQARITFLNQLIAQLQVLIARLQLQL